MASENVRVVVRAAKGDSNVVYYDNYKRENCMWWYHGSLSLMEPLLKKEKENYLFVLGINYLAASTFTY